MDDETTLYFKHALIQNYNYYNTLTDTHTYYPSFYNNHGTIENVVIRMWWHLYSYEHTAFMPNIQKVFFHLSV